MEMDIREAVLNPNTGKFFQLFDKPKKKKKDLLMEFMAGGRYGHLIEACGYMKEEKVWPVFHQVASAVQCLHKRNFAHHDKDIAHRDIKAENVLFDVDRNNKLQISRWS